MSYRRLIVALCLAASAAYAPPSRARPSRASPSHASPSHAGPSHDAEIGRSCARGILRFCPELAGTTQPHNQRICLRPYRTSLTLKCRRLLKR